MTEEEREFEKDIAEYAEEWFLAVAMGEGNVCEDELGNIRVYE
ncbi:hypothetical protein [Carnobacterium pleistocenium]|nr:hypothetical protein [Carnobacterium pleistocenium]